MNEKEMYQALGLEKRTVDDHQDDERLIVLAKTKDGKEKEMTVDECLAEEADFMKIIRGSNIQEFDRLMGAAFDKALSEYQN